MKPLRRLKQTELMRCNYAPLLRLLWFYMQALVSATSAGSRGPFFFQDQWACPCWALGGHRSMSKTSRVFSLTPSPPLAAPLLFLNCDPHAAKVSGLACMREGAQYSPNINQTQSRKDTVYTEHTQRARQVGLKGHLLLFEQLKADLICFLCFTQYTICHIHTDGWKLCLDATCGAVGLLLQQKQTITLTRVQFCMNN